MNLVSEIYQQVICKNRNVMNEENKRDEKITSICKKYSEWLGEEKVETLVEDIYSVIMETEELGFLLGIQFIMQLLSECNSNIN